MQFYQQYVPDDIIFVILSFLDDPSHIPSIALTCKVFQRFALSTELWAALRQRGVFQASLIFRLIAADPQKINIQSLLHRLIYELEIPIEHAHRFLKSAHKNCYRPLNYAIGHKNLPACLWLLEHGAVMDPPDCVYPAILAALRYGKSSSRASYFPELVPELLDRGVDVNLAFSQWGSEAPVQEWSNASRLQEAALADPDFLETAPLRRDWHPTPLSAAVEALAAMAQENLETPGEHAPLDLSCVELLLQRGAKTWTTLDVRGPAEPVHSVVYHYSLLCNSLADMALFQRVLTTFPPVLRARILTEYRSTEFTCDCTGPLLLFAVQRHAPLEVVEYLLQHTFDANVTPLDAGNRMHFNPLGAALVAGASEQAVAILENLRAHYDVATCERAVNRTLITGKEGAPSSTYFHASFLQAALRFGPLGRSSCAVVRLLLECGANPEAVLEDTPLTHDARPLRTHAPPLLLAVMHRDVALVRALLDHCADPDRAASARKSQEAWTPLHWAAQHGPAEVVESLLAAEARPLPLTRVQRDGPTPLALAAAAGQVGCLAALLEAPCDAAQLETAMKAAVRRGRLECVRLLAERAGLGLQGARDQARKLLQRRTRRVSRAALQAVEAYAASACE